MNLTERFLRFHEGVRSKRYLDSVGHPTIGVGHNLDAAPPLPAVAQIQKSAGKPADDEWTDESISLQLQHDVAGNCSWLWGKPWWAGCAEARQAALNDWAFNLGPETAQTFMTFLGLVAAGDWAAAAADLLQTKAGRELPTRYGHLAQAIRDGIAGPWLPAETT